VLENHCNPWGFRLWHTASTAPRRTSKERRTKDVLASGPTDLESEIFVPQAKILFAERQLNGLPSNKFNAAAAVIAQESTYSPSYLATP